MALSTQAAANGGIQPPYYVRKTSAGTEAVDILYSTFYEAGEPAAATAPSPGLNGAALTSYAGQIPFTNPVSGNTYLWQFEVVTSASAGTFATAQVVYLLDRLWHNSGIVATTTTEQAITSGAMPARDINGSTNGEGLMAALEVSTTGTNGAVTTITLNYTNSAGTAGRTATMASFPATALAGTFIPFQLAAGDTGIRSIQGITLGTTLTSITMHLVVYRVLDMSAQNLDRSTANTAETRRDMHTSGFVRMFDNTVPFIVLHPSNASGNANHVRGVFRVAQG